MEMMSDDKKQNWYDLLKGVLSLGAAITGAFIMYSALNNQELSPKDLNEMEAGMGLVSLLVLGLAVNGIIYMVFSIKQIINPTNP